MSFCHIPWTKMEIHENRMAGCYLALPQQHWQMKQGEERYWDYLLRPFIQLRNSQESVNFRQSYANSRKEDSSAELAGNKKREKSRCNGGFLEFPDLSPQAPDDVKENYSLLRREWEKGMAELQSYPLTWTISLGASCRLRCVMCPINHSVQIPPMPVPVAQKLRPLLDYATNICITGGEPLDAPIETLDTLLPLRAPYRNITVLTALSASSEVVELLPQRVDNVSVSLSSWDQKTYEVVQVGGDFSQVISNIKQLAGKVRLECSTIVTRSTLETLEQMPLFLSELGFNSWTPTPMASLKETEEDIFIPERWFAYRSRFIEIYERGRAAAEAVGLPVNWRLMEAKIK